MNREALTLPEFCRVFSISRTAAYREIKSGRLRRTKLGRRTLVARADADAWFQSLRAATPEALEQAA